MIEDLKLPLLYSNSLTFFLAFFVSEESVYKCDICDKVFNLDSTLRKHKLTHQTREAYVCLVEGCGKAFKVSEYFVTIEYYYD